MNDTTPRLQLPLIGDHSQKRIVMNDGLMRLESLVQAQVLSRTLVAQPASPADGDSYILPASPTGAIWSLLAAGAFVRAEGGLWETVVFPEGAIVYVKAEGVFVVRTSTGWMAFEDAIKTLNNLDRAGIGTSADTYNVLAVKGPAALLTGKSAAEGGSGDISFSVNKEADANSAQILLQKNYSSRAIFGLLGDNNLTIKVSPDGSAFAPALSINSTTVATTFSGAATFSNAAGSFGTATTAATYGLATGATTTGLTKAVNIGTAGLSGSTTAITVGASASGATTNWTLYSAAPLFANSAGTVQLTLNKAANTDTASLLIKAAGASRAEFGALGNNDTTLKVSGDGTNWRSAFTINRFSGRMRLGRTFYKSAMVPQRNYVAGTAWLTSTSAANNAWNSLCWAAELGLFCAVSTNGTGGTVMTSPDGMTWTQRTGANDSLDWRSVCWSAELSLFVAVAGAGTGTRLMTSPDGITWTSRTSSDAGNAWYGVCWSSELGMFVAVSNTASTSTRAMWSTDGLTWTAATSGVAANAWSDVCWAPELGLFCAVASTGTGNRVMTSADGKVWTARTSAADNSWKGVCWSAELNLLVAVGDSGTGNRVMTSPDGITWTLRTSAADNGWESVCWAPDIGLFAAISNTGTGNRVMTSPDGVTWTTRTSAADNSWSDLCWSPELGLFAACGTTGTGNRIMTSVSMFKYPYRG